jgi:hypothetical protein
MTDKGKWKIAFAVLALAFNAGLVVWLMLYGKPDNSLHTSALSWAFTLSVGVLAGGGFGAVADLIPGFKPRDQAGALLLRQLSRACRGQGGQAAARRLGAVRRSLCRET